MARPHIARNNTTLKRRSLQTGGFLSKFRRRIRTRTQKIMNRNPLGYIAQFKKVYPKGEITGTDYKYLIMGHEDTLMSKLPTVADIDEIISKEIYGILNPYANANNHTHPLNMLLTKLWNKGKLGLLSKHSDNNIVLINSKNTTHANIINKETYTPIRIFIYKPSSQEQQTLANNIQSSGSRRSSHRRSVSSHQESR